MEKIKTLLHIIMTWAMLALLAWAALSVLEIVTKNISTSPEYSPLNLFLLLL